jgi:hypothetical protein
VLEGGQALVDGRRNGRQREEFGSSSRGVIAASDLVPTSPRLDK